MCSAVGPPGYRHSALVVLPILPDSVGVGGVSGLCYHELRTGTMSVRVDDSLRIVFRTQPMPEPQKGEEILILEVIDYHE